MDVTRKDAEHAEVLLTVLGKLRFDVSGIECLKLADALTWAAQLKQRILGDCDTREAVAAKLKLRDEMVKESRKCDEQSSPS